MGVIACHSSKCFVAASLVAILLSGCTDQYPSDMKYPLRDDPLLTSNISAVARVWDKPGDFPRQMLVTIPTEERKSTAQKFKSPEDISGSEAEQLESALEDVFGTPFEPRVGGITAEGIEKLKLDESRLADGSVLYRAHCLHCHGLTGNGRGPTAPWVNPHPRDYRQGIFKFTSTLGGNDRKPRRDDLLRTVKKGIEGTSMPSFGLLPENDLEALASYVIHLSLRGEVEFTVMQELIEGSASVGVKTAVPEYLQLFTNRWIKSAAESSVIRPDPNFPFPSDDTPNDDQRRESVQRGWILFKDPKGEASCVACHRDYGRQSELKYDQWGTIVRATDLTKGVYRGGNRRIDLYWRIHTGLLGSNMPGIGNELSSESYKNRNKHDGVWDLVNFLEVLPHKTMREKYGVQID